MDNGIPKTTLEFLDALKSLKGNASDYRIAQILGVKPQAVSKWRHGISFFDDETSELVAKELGIKPEYVIACIHAERAKTDSQRAIWERLAALAATFVFAVGVLAVQVPLF